MSSQDAQWRPGGNLTRAMRDERWDPNGRTIADFDHAAEKIVVMRLCDFHHSDVARTGLSPAGFGFDVREVKLAIDFRSYTLQPRFPDEFLLPRGPFDESGQDTADEAAQALRRDFSLELHQTVAPAGNRLGIDFSAEGVACGIFHVGIREDAQPIEFSGSHKVAE